MPPSNRDRILEGAIECVQTRGIADTTARDIAAAAGASLASIPYHFGSKEALLDLALRRAMERYTDHLRDLVLANPGDDSGETLARTFEVLVDSFGASEPLMASLMESYVRALHNDTHRERIAEHRRNLVERLTVLIEQATPDREPGTDTRVIAIVLLSLIDGLMLHWLMEPDDLPAPAALVDSLTSINQVLATREPAPGA